MASRKLVVELVGDSRSLDRTFAKSSRNAKKFQRDMTVALGGAGGARALAGRNAYGAAALAATAGILKTTQAASNLNEEISKNQQIFGIAAKSVEAWSKTTLESFKLNQTEALRGAGAYGQMFRTIGLGQTEAAVMSKRLVQLGADLGSFNNIDPAEMLDRLRSGLAGEAEPLRQFGVFLSEAAVKAEAYSSGLAKVGSKLTEQQKVQARYQLILAQTTQAQGDAARTGDQYAGQMRELKGQVQELSTQIGNGLLPFMTDLVTIANDVIAGIDGVRGAIERLNDVIPDGVGWAKRFGDALKQVVPGVGPLAQAFGALQRRAREEAAREKAKGAMAGIHDRPLPTAIAGRYVPPPPPPRGATMDQRNAWFDAKIAREISRAQDLSASKQRARLADIAKEIRAKLSITKDATRRLTLEDQLLDIYRQQRSIQEGITSAIKQGNDALKDRANQIKSAILDRLQRRETDVLNKRALEDAKERLRIARMIGGPGGIKAALRGMEDVRFDMLRARIENAPASLTRGGQFALGGVVNVTINGVTDPDKVARAVIAAIQRQGRRTTTQMRGPTTATA